MCAIVRRAKQDDSFIACWFDEFSTFPASGMSMQTGLFPLESANWTKIIEWFRKRFFRLYALTWISTELHGCASSNSYSWCLLRGNTHTCWHVTAWRTHTYFNIYQCPPFPSHQTVRLALSSIRRTLDRLLSTVPIPVSSSSSIGTTAHCGLWPVEQNPSIISHLPPTLSTFSLPALEDLFLLSYGYFRISIPLPSAQQYTIYIIKQNHTKHTATYDRK